MKLKEAARKCTISYFGRQICFDGEFFSKVAGILLWGHTGGTQTWGGGQFGKYAYTFEPLDLCLQFCLIKSLLLGPILITFQAINWRENQDQFKRAKIPLYIQMYFM